VKRAEIMVVAGDPSGDANAADLVRSLAEMIPASQFQITPAMQPLTTPLAPRFFGAGGPRMAAAGVELAFDLTADAAIGLGGLLRQIPKLWRLRNELLRRAVERKPDVILLVDYGGFNLRLAGAIRAYLRRHAGTFFNWRPKIVQFTSPQVWASRPGRAFQMAKNYDLVLSLFEFEKEWFAARVPNLPVEFVGHPILDRYAEQLRAPRHPDASPPLVLLLPGSRCGEVRRHAPIMGAAAALIASRHESRFKMIVPDETLAAVARQSLAAGPAKTEVQVGGLAKALSSATLALIKTGTVTMECAVFGVPAVAMYRADPMTYFIGRRIVTAKYLSMPNVIAGEAIYPELIQGEATPANLAAAAEDLLTLAPRRAEVRVKLAKVVHALGTPGAGRRAAAAIVKLIGPP